MIHFYVLTPRAQLAIAREIAEKSKGRITFNKNDVIVTAPRRVTTISVKRWEN
jgi:hypothetical protein